MTPTPWTLTIGEARVSARWYGAAGPESRLALVLAHGAGAGHGHPFMVALARALALRGVDVVTFNFPHMEARRRRPDPPAALEQAVAEVFLAARARGELAGRRFFAGGKSMGGRLATQVAARGADAPPGLEGVVCFGYPLKPPGRPAPRSMAHLGRSVAPVLILQGTRDAFGGPDDVRAALAGSTARVDVVAVDDADHGFAVPKRSGRTEAEVMTYLVEHTSNWMAQVLGRSVAS